MNRALVIPASESYFCKSVPKIVAKHAVRKPDLTLAGVYMWIYDRRYVYIGSASRLSKRIRYHVRLMARRIDYINTSKKHTHVARKHADTAELIILENEDMPMSEAYARERKWLKFFAERAPKGLLLNDHMLPGGGLSNKKAMKKRWNAEARAERSTHMKAQSKKQWADPEFREMQRQRLARLWADPTFRAAQALRPRMKRADYVAMYGEVK